MLLESSPLEKTQAQTATTLDPSPLLKQLTEYITNCIIEDKAAGTIELYSQRLQEFARTSPGLAPADIRLFFQSLIERGLAPSTRNAYYRAIKTFLNWMIAEGYLDKNPLENIKPPRIPRKLPMPFSMDELDKLLALCSGNRFLEIRNRAMLLTFLDTGLRLAELARIRLVDIDILNGVIMVMGKGAKERRVRIGKISRKAVFKYLSMRKDNLPDLWLSEERRPMTRDGVKVTIKHLCQRAGIRGGPHKLRHTAAINYLRNGGTEFTLQVMLGHSTLQMTRHYSSSLNSEDMMRVHEKASPVDRMGLR